MSLNSEQTIALTAVKKGRNIFLTGAGGTGKSHTIRAIIEWASLRVAVTAMTGCAALLLNYDTCKVKAKTLHSWAGIGLGKGSPSELAEAVKRSKHATKRWIQAQLLIVDEISMMTPGLLERLDYVARQVRKQPDTRFGGLQIVFAGDFCQLPPIGSATAMFAFESPLWSTLIDETHNLTQIVRQADPVFQKILTEARLGDLSPESLAILQSRKGLDWSNPAMEIRPTLLYARNIDVDKINRLNMEALEGERRIYEVKTCQMESGFRSKSKSKYINPNDVTVQAALTKLDQDAPYLQSLELCEGAQVMLLTNLDQAGGLVNGSRGIITGFGPTGPMVRFLNQKEPVLIERASWWLPSEETDKNKVGRTQIPLRIAYAITIHKSQGATLDSALVDIGSNTFEYGQAYVALSRCRSLEGLYVWNLSPHMILCHPTVKRFYQDLASLSSASLASPTSPDHPWTSTIESLSPAWSTVIEPRIYAVKVPGNAEDISPPHTDVFAALRACPNPAAVKVIILGQDPYPTAGLAHGMAFSVRPETAKLPASLQNIFKELSADLSVPVPTNGNLQRWADQGVLLLNDILTVQIGKPLSHAGQGWEPISTALIAAVLKAADHVVIMAWGRTAQKKLENSAIKPYLSKHTFLPAPHPSPLSAHTGFYGSKPFSQTNAALIAHGQEAICW